MLLKQSQILKVPNLQVVTKGLARASRSTQRARRKTELDHGPSVLQDAKRRGINLLELFLWLPQTPRNHPQNTFNVMASVYKTLSGKDNHEKESGEKRNKQRVLILVCAARRSRVACAKKILEFQRCHIPSPSSASGLVFIDVCTIPLADFQ